jgi:hypothetical protein
VKEKLSVEMNKKGAVAYVRRKLLGMSSSSGADERSGADQARGSAQKNEGARRQDEAEGEMMSRKVPWTAGDIYTCSLPAPARLVSICISSPTRDFGLVANAPAEKLGDGSLQG